MKKAIIIQNCENYNTIKEHEKYCDSIFVDTNSEERILQKYNIDYYLHLLENEEIVFCKSFDNNTKTFISDGNWMIPSNRIYPERPRNGNPCVIKTNKFIELPFIENNQLKTIFQEKNYSEFVLESEKFIFENPRYNDKFLEYYMSMTFFFKLNDYKKAQLYLSRFINMNLNFAEGWCLLGDFLIHMKKNVEAIRAYENAMEYGKKRDVYDGLPICLKKYISYPQEMLSKIRHLLENTAVLSVDHL
jgi:tetratricopeptide (TPR) repeat protein